MQQQRTPASPPAAVSLKPFIRECSPTRQSNLAPQQQMQQQQQHIQANVVQMSYGELSMPS